jgi:hypothetical protein
VTSQQVWVLVFGCLAIGLAVAFGSRALVLRFLPTEDRAEAHAIASAPTTSFAAAFVLLAALTVANEVTSLSAAQTIVTRTYEWRGSAAANGDDVATDNALAAMEPTVRGQTAPQRSVHPPARCSSPIWTR